MKLLPNFVSYKYLIKGSALELTIHESEVRVSVNEIDLPAQSIILEGQRPPNKPNAYYANIKLTLDNSRILENNKEKFKINLSKLTCWLTSQYDEPIPLRNRTEYIFVHPQDYYDQDSLMTHELQDLMNEVHRPIILLDIPVYPLEFTKDYDPKNKTIKVTQKFDKDATNPKEKLNEMLDNFGENSYNFPEDSQLIASYLGYNSFSLSHTKHKVVYSGGFFNFCMFNNSVALVYAFLNHSKTRQLTIVYNVDGITLQTNSNVPTYLPNRNDLSLINNELNSTYDMVSVFKGMGVKLSRDYLKTFINVLMTIMKKHLKDISDTQWTILAKKYGLHRVYNSPGFFGKKPRKRINIIFE